MQSRHLVVGSAAEHDGRRARPQRRKVDAEGVRVIAVGVEAKTLAHRRDRHLPANRRLPAADDDLDAGPSMALGWGSVSTPGPSEYQPHKSLQISGCSGACARRHPGGRGGSGGLRSRRAPGRRGGRTSRCWRTRGHRSPHPERAPCRCGSPSKTIKRGRTARLTTGPSRALSAGCWRRLPWPEWAAPPHGRRVDLVVSALRRGATSAAGPRIPLPHDRARPERAQPGPVPSGAMRSWQGARPSNGIERPEDEGRRVAGPEPLGGPRKHDLHRQRADDDGRHPPAAVAVARSRPFRSRPLLRPQPPLAQTAVTTSLHGEDGVPIAAALATRPPGEPIGGWPGCRRSWGSGGTPTRRCR